VASLRDLGVDVIDCDPMAHRLQRYPSDTSDEQCEVIEALLPRVNTAGPPGETPAPGDRGRDLVRGAHGVRLAAAEPGIDAVSQAVTNLVVEGLTRR
jgi:hypothetical protein